MVAINMPPPTPLLAAYASPFSDVTTPYISATPGERLIVHLARPAKHPHRHHRHHRYHGYHHRGYAHKAHFTRGGELVYNVPTGTLLYQGVIIQRAQSGLGEARNNPADQDIRDKGPTPVGLYTIGRPTESRILGQDVMYIWPRKGTNTLATDGKPRFGFAMHAEKSAAGSHGCIVTANSAAQKELVAFVEKYHIRTLRVTTSVNLKPKLIPVSNRVTRTYSGSSLPLWTITPVKEPPAASSDPIASLLLQLDRVKKFPSPNL